MMKRVANLMPGNIHLIALTCIMAITIGCKPNADTADSGKADAGHTEKDLTPATFADALKQLTVHKTNIQVAFEKSDPESAHDDLHDIGHLIESLEKLAKSSGVSESDLAEVKASADSLFDAYGKLDEMMHGGDEVAYKDLADKIDAALLALHKFAPK